MMRNEPTHSTPDAQLLAEFASSGDASAFEELVRRYHGLVLGVCRRVLGNRHDAEDAFQATFLVLAKDAHKIRKERALASWLYGVAYRIAIKAGKKRHAQPKETVMDTTTTEEGPFQKISRRDEQRIVDEELHQLPDKYRGALVLHYLSQCTSREIASELGISLTAVEGRLKRGRRALRRRLTRRGVGLAGFAAVIGLSRQSIAAYNAEPLIASTVDSSVAYVGGQAPVDSLGYQLAQSEILEMAVTTKKAASLVTATVIAVGLGLYGAASMGVGQEKQGATLTVALQSGAEEPEVATRVTPVRTMTPPTTAATVNQYREAIEDIEKQLDRRDGYDFSFDELQLDDIADYLQQQLEIPVVVDWRALEDEGHSRDSLFTFELDADNVSARSALRLFLRSYDLNFTIGDEVLQITTNVVAESALDARVYSVDQLRLDSDTLIRIITSSVAPDTWDEVGGPGSIEDAGVALVIRQSQDVHEKIDDLLSQLRRVSQQQQPQQRARN